MWATKRKTKQAKAHHTNRLKIVSIVGGVLLLVSSAVGYLVFLYLVPPPLLRPIPLGTEIASADVRDESIEEIQKQLQSQGIEVETITQTNTDYKIKIAENGEVLLSKNRNLSSQLASLQVILVRLTMEGKRFSKLDLRFDKPVITTN